MDLVLRLWFGMGSLGDKLSKLIEWLCVLEMHNFSRADQALKEIEEKNLQFVVLRNALRRLEVHSVEHTGDFLEDLVVFYDLASRLHDEETWYLDRFTALAEDSGPHDEMATALEEFIGAVRTHGRQKGIEGAMNQTVPGELVSLDNVELCISKSAPNWMRDLGPMSASKWRTRFASVQTPLNIESMEKAMIRQQVETAIKVGTSAILEPLEKIIAILEKKK